MIRILLVIGLLQSIAADPSELICGSDLGAPKIIGQNERGAIMTLVDQDREQSAVKYSYYVGRYWMSDDEFRAVPDDDSVSYFYASSVVTDFPELTNAHSYMIQVCAGMHSSDMALFEPTDIDWSHVTAYPVRKAESTETVTDSEDSTAVTAGESVSASATDDEDTDSSSDESTTDMTSTVDDDDDDQTTTTSDTDQTSAETDSDDTTSAETETDAVTTDEFADTKPVQTETEPSTTEDSADAASSEESETDASTTVDVTADPESSEETDADTSTAGVSTDAGSSSEDDEADSTTTEVTADPESSEEADTDAPSTVVTTDTESSEETETDSTQDDAVSSTTAAASSVASDVTGTTSAAEDTSETVDSEVSLDNEPAKTIVSSTKDPLCDVVDVSYVDISSANGTLTISYSWNKKESSYSQIKGDIINYVVRYGPMKSNEDGVWTIDPTSQQFTVTNGDDGEYVALTDVVPVDHYGLQICAQTESNFANTDSDWWTMSAPTLTMDLGEYDDWISAVSTTATASSVSATTTSFRPNCDLVDTSYVSMQPADDGSLNVLFTWSGKSENYDKIGLIDHYFVRHGRTSCDNSRIDEADAHYFVTQNATQSIVITGVPIGSCYALQFCAVQKLFDNVQVSDWNSDAWAGTMDFRTMSSIEDDSTDSASTTESTEKEDIGGTTEAGKFYASKTPLLPKATFTTALVVGIAATVVFLISAMFLIISIIFRRNRQRDIEAQAIIEKSAHF